MLASGRTAAAGVDVTPPLMDDKFKPPAPEPVPVPPAKP